MKKTNWLKVEGFAKEFQNADELRREDIAFDIMQELEGYLNTCVINANKSACLHSTFIPKEDFESNMKYGVWKALKDFDEERGSFQGLLAQKIRFAEMGTWREYEVTDKDAKNGRSYVKAQWDSIDRKVGGGEGGSDSDVTLYDVVADFAPSVEDVFVEDHEVFDIIQAFATKNERYAEIIAFIYEGYEGIDLANRLGEETYSSKIRKTVQRAKESFGKFMNHYHTIAAV